jgi:hypothetical protein
MTIKDIVKTTAVLMGNEEICDYLDGGEYSEADGARLQKEVDVLIKCSNLTINEIATEYIPVVTVESVTNFSGYIYFNSLLMDVLKVIAVYDNQGNKLSFKPVQYGIKTSNSACRIEYSYIPPEYNLSSTIDFEEKNVPKRVVAYGVASQVCIIEGKFDEAGLWNSRFKDSVTNIAMPKRAKLKGRYWQ